MNIDEWFKDKDYFTGVALYASLPKSSKNILSRLQRGNNPKNRATLKYELTKYRKSSINIIVQSPVQTIIQKEVLPPVTSIKEQQIQNAVISSNKRVTMSMLPDPYLREKYVQKNNAFYQYCELKYKLNDLPAEKESEALDLILEIMKLNTFIDQVWKEIDYFLEHKKLLPSPNDYTSLSYKEQIKKLQLLYQRRSKRKGTIGKWQVQLDECKDKIKASKLKGKISQKTEELNQIEIDIQTLKKLTNE
jgi:hypothetical protein